ncbi:MAG: thioredoxin family protein [Acidimicrobiia bacterium]
MTEPAVRLLVVVLVMVSAWLVAQAWRRGARPGMVGAGPFGPGPAVVVFTSAGCGECAPVLEMVGAAAGKRLFREVRFEDQPDLFERAGVGAVPLTVVVAADGRVEQFAGMPPRRRLARAIERLGE